MPRASTRISARRGPGHEWLVDVVAMPRLLSGETATALLVYELPSHLVIAIEALGDASPAAIVGVMEPALRRRADDGLPMPARVRTAVRSVVDALSRQSMVPVVHAPTPELAPAIRSLLEHLERATTRPSLDSFVPLDHTALFGAAANLYRAAPWETLENDDLLVIDCRALGLKEAVVSTMGHEKEQFGFLLFDDEEDYERFLDLAEEVAEGRLRPKRRSKLAYLALDFTPRSELSPKLGKALRSREVPLAAPDAIPLAYRIVGGVHMQPADDDAVRTLTIVTEAIGAFWRKHGATLRAKRAEKTLTIEVGDVTIAVSGPLYGVDDDTPVVTSTFICSCPSCRRARCRRQRGCTRCGCGYPRACSTSARRAWGTTSSTSRDRSSTSPKPTPSSSRCWWRSPLITSAGRSWTVKR